MKKGLLFLLLVSSMVTQAQSLKEALFSGKLKNEAGTVIRKGDDLSTKIDTTTRKTVTADTAQTKAPLLALDSSAKKMNMAGDSTTLSNAKIKDTNALTAEVTPAPAAADTATVAAPVKDNNVLWKEYMATATTLFNTEVLSSKKIKNGTYYATVSYTIGTDGQVEITDVFLTPDNAYLKQQIKDRLQLDAPRLHPVLSSTGTPRKVNRKYNFTLTKE